MKPSVAASRHGTSLSLLEMAGVDAADLGPARQYLLFAAAGPASGGVSDLLKVFDSEDEARGAFLRLRRDDRLRRGWAELAALNRRGGVSVLCSFGLGRPVPWRPRRFVHPPQAAKEAAMSTTTPTKPERPTSPPQARPSRIRYVLATAVLGLAFMGAGVLVTIRGDSTRPAPRPAPAATQRAPSNDPSSGDETFPGCLSDIECDGEPSHLPPGNWDLPVASSVDRRGTDSR